jgi:hypothetical protein
MLFYYLSHTQRFGCDGVFGCGDEGICAVITGAAMRMMLIICMTEFVLTICNRKPAGDGIVILSRLMQSPSCSTTPAVSSTTATVPFVVPLVPLDNNHEVTITHLSRSNISSHDIAMHIRHSQSAASIACVLSLSCGSGTGVNNSSITRVQSSHLLLDTQHSKSFSSPPFLTLDRSGAFAFVSHVSAQNIQATYMSCPI